MTSVATAQPVVLLHLSDLHFGNDDGSQTEKDAKQAILSSLLKKLQALPADWKPNVVCISGDIASRAKREDYDKAEAWMGELLQKLGLTAADLILCPGNHDIDRGKVLNAPDAYKEADALFKIPVSDTDPLHVPFAEYSAFCARLGTPPYTCGDRQSYLVGVRQHCGLTFAIHNSAWFAKDSKTDNGHLWLGLPLLQHMDAKGQYAALCTPPAETVITLIHHPFDWLHDAEKHQRDYRKSTKEYICYRSSILLTGHTHDTVTDPTPILNRCWHFPAGATYDHGQHFNTFRLIRISPPQLEERSYEYDPRSPDDAWRQKGDGFSAPLVFRPEFLRVMASNTHLFMSSGETATARETSDAGLRSLQTVDTDGDVIIEDRENTIDAENKRIAALINSGHTRVAQGEIAQLYKRAKEQNVSKTLLGRISNNLGICLLENGSTADAADSFKSSTEYSPDNPTMWANFAQAQSRMGDLERARVAMEKARQLRPLDPHVLNVYSDYLIHSGHKEQFGELLLEVATVEDESPEWRLLVAQLHFDAGHVLESKRLLQEIEKTGELQTQAKELLARVLVECVHTEAKQSMKLARQLPKEMQADVEKAVKLLDDVIAACGDYDSHHVRRALLTNRASANLLLEKWDAALSDYEKVLALEPDNERVIHARLVALIGAKRFDEAMKAANPETDSLLSFGLAGSLVEAGLPEEALRVLDKISAKTEEEALDKIRWQLKAWKQLSNKEKVESLIGKLETEYPSNAEALCVRAEHAYQTSPDAAVQLLKDGLTHAVEPTRRQTIALNLANLLLSLSRHPEAVELLENVDYTKDPQLHKKYAAGLYFVGRADKALAIIAKNLDDWKADPEIIGIYVQILESIGDFPKAVEFAKLLVSLAPEHIGYRLILARVQPGVGDYEGAKETVHSIDAERALLNAEYIAPLAFHYRCLGYPDIALELMFRAREKYSSNPDIHQAYIGIYLSLPADHAARRSPETVEIGSVVNFTQDKRQHSFLIVDREDADLQKHEISANSSMAQKLLGKKVGDEVVVKDQPLERSTVKIDAISSRYGFAFGQSLNMFSTWFPERADIQKGDISQPEGIKKMIAARSKRLDMIFTTYRNNQLPAGSVARMLGTTLPQFWLDVIDSPGMEFRCSTGFVDDLNPQHGSVESAEYVVLDITAVLSIALLEIEELLIKAFKRIIIPGAVLAEIEQAIQDETMAAKSQVPTNTPWGTQIEKRKNLLLRAKQLALRLGLDPTPEILAEISAQICDLFGKSGAAASLLAQREKAALYSDDLALRLVLRNEHQVPGFCTAVLLTRLARLGYITPDQYAMFISKLLHHGYWFVPVSAGDLFKIFKADQGIVTENFRGIARGLSKPCDLDVLIAVVVDFMQMLWLGGIAFAVSDLFLQALLRQLFTQYPMADVEAMLVNVVRSRLRHMPTICSILIFTAKQCVKNVLQEASIEKLNDEHKPTPSSRT
jgi:tetratricopeptide (TPR) repeat protein/calcineurin-like phosphoesterase family protein